MGCSSLKKFLQQRRGKRRRQRVTGSAPLPKNWHEVLRVDENKAELFHFLSLHIAKIEADEKELIATDGQEVVCTSDQENQSQLSPCCHEKADTRIYVHCAHAASKGHNRIMIKIVDTRCCGACHCLFSANC